MTEDAPGGLESAARPGGLDGARFPCVDGLRAIAAGLVLLTHAAHETGVVGSHWAGRYFSRMDVGVAVFFVISGFLLYRPFVADHLAGRPPMGAARFWRRRALRIFPAYWVALTLILFVLGQRAGTRTVADGAIYYGLVQTYFPDHVIGGMSQAWSLCTEIAFYAVLPAWAWVVRRAGAAVGAGRRGRLVAEVGGVALWYAGGLAVRAAIVTSGLPERHFGAVTWLPSTLDLFALGMGLAVASVWAARRGDEGEGRVVAAVGRHPGLWWALAAVSFWVVSARVGGVRGVDADASAVDWMARQVLFGAVALFLVLPAMFGAQDRGLVRGFLRSRVMVAAGLVSYGVYLWHHAWIFEVQDLLGVERLGGRFVAVTAGTVVLTAMSAALTYVLVERPALRLKDRGRPAVAPVPATVAGPS